jgi:hypothetical protein
VKFCMVHTGHNVADPLMIPLPQPKHEAQMRSMVLDTYMSDVDVSGRLVS